MAMSPTVEVGTTGTYLNYKLVSRYLSNDLAIVDNHGNEVLSPALIL